VSLNDLRMARDAEMRDLRAENKRMRESIDALLLDRLTRNMNPQEETVGQRAERMLPHAVYVWDSALPQTWVDQVRPLVAHLGLDPYGQFVWCYGEREPVSTEPGVTGYRVQHPHPITCEGALILDHLAARAMREAAEAKAKMRLER